METINRRSVVLGVLGTAAFGAHASAQSSTKWDMYAMTGVTHPITLRYKEFAEEVKKATNGKLDIVVRPAGELPFRATEVVKVAGDGQVQITEAYQGFISGSTPLASMTSLPFLVRSGEELDKVWPIIDKFTAPLFHKAGVKNLFYHTWPVQNMFGRGKPIRTIEDFKGRKIRSTDGKQAEMLKQLGASSVSLTTAEVPVAMERGVAEGFITAGFNVIGAKWYEFVEWAWLGDIHIGGPDYTLVNIEAYNKLDADTRAKLDAVAKSYAPKFRAANLGDEAKDLEALKTQYKVDVFVPPKEQIDALIAKMQPYWEQWAAAQGSSGTAMLKEIRAALGK
ncbi:MAG: TRAP transporter substrate-binding protein [Pseudomonadota bacterium]